MLDGQSEQGYLSVENAYDLERAIDFMQVYFAKSPDQPKPVRIHCIRVALMLAADGLPMEIVYAGLFHDLIEDTEATRSEIAEVYGEKVASIVEANSYDPKFTERKPRDRDLYERCVETGYEACLVKAADIYDNSLYFRPVETERRAWFTEKIGLLLELSTPLIGEYAMWKRLSKRYTQLLG